MSAAETIAIAFLIAWASCIIAMAICWWIIKRKGKL